MAIFTHVVLGTNDIDKARKQLAGDAERQIALIARLDLTDGLAVVVDGFGDRHNGADRSRRRLRRLRLAARDSREQRECEKNN